jgi:2'-5' RNA ligase
MSEPTLRVFFALWPDEAVRAELAHATQKAARGSGGRPVPSENLHATLLFLGSVAESRVADLVGVAARAASAAEVGASIESGATPDFLFDRVELWTKAHVLVATTSATVSPAHTLAQALANVLQRETAALRFTPDLKSFRAHVTLARKVVRVSRALEMRPVRWSLDGFALVQSRTEPEGSVYTVLGRFPFGW